MREQNMLQDVITHFSKDPEQKRSFSGHCLYNPPEDQPESIGCAIGMYLSAKLAQKLDDLDNSSIDLILQTEDSELLPKWMQEMDVSFLGKIQSLHDEHKNWTETNISSRGKQFVRKICKKYKLSYKDLIFKENK